jgi:hypothetical protein
LKYIKYHFTTNKFGPGWICLLLIFLNTFPAHSLEENKSDTVINSTAEETKNILKIKNSAGNRIGKKFLLTVGLEEKGTNASAGYFLKSDQILGLEFAQGNLGNYQSIDIYNNEYKSLSFYYKEFLGNSFYFRTDILYKKYYTDNWSANPHRDHNEPNGRFNTLGAELKIGNQWQWDHLSLGCDWVGLHKAFLVSANSTSKTFFRDEGFAIDILNFYFGISF